MSARGLHLLIMLFLLVNGMAQTTHTIRGRDFFYDPDTVWMQVGDSIRFQPQGIHDMVQTDSAFWAIGQAIGNGGFHTAIGQDTTFVIATPGTIYFVCSPHGIVGMHGVLLVDGTTSARGPSPILARVRTYPVPATDRLFLDPAPTNGTHVEVLDPLGRCVIRAKLDRSAHPSIAISGLDPARYTLLIKDRLGEVIGLGSFVTTGQE